MSRIRFVAKSSTAGRTSSDGKSATQSLLAALSVPSVRDRSIPMSTFACGRMGIIARPELLSHRGHAGVLHVRPVQGRGDFEVHGSRAKSWKVPLTEIERAITESAAEGSLEMVTALG